ncbi:hypothetical protein QFC22_004763 [Naganishia vaughanmartiniae]|uniref:Uncharacterized protein n=1 Tax=Naganishia vaughanmartiniae TaxID=1424756 RepID=A0ACC2WXU3_9TREE|nr:hypothetical protein QFC22_004763 [Naganishia vaughanmartiniae]
MDLDLRDVHVLITGAAGGIGLATVTEFLGHSALVSAHYRSTKAALEESVVCAEAARESRLACVQADVTKEEDVMRMFQEAEEKIGKPVTVLVVNHAVYNSTPAPLHTMSLSQWNETLTTNLTGSFLVLRQFLARLAKVKEEQGIDSEWMRNVAVVLIGSTAGEFGEAGHADYAASKSALTHGLQLSLKNEIVQLHPRARVNTVAPGWVRTKMAEESMKDERIKYQALATTSLNKIAEPEEVARQVALLASNRVSGHTTGQVVMIHGGMEGEWHSFAITNKN